MCTEHLHFVHHVVDKVEVTCVVDVEAAGLAVEEGTACDGGHLGLCVPGVEEGDSCIEGVNLSSSLKLYSMQLHLSNSSVLPVNISINDK